MARKAFILGINTLGLQYCERDAMLMNECLEVYHYNILMPRGNKFELLQKYQEFIDNSAKTDTILFYFSGHAVVKGGKLCLLVDDRKTSISNSYIIVDEIIEPLEKYYTENKLIILDCCNANRMIADWQIKQSDYYRIMTASEYLEEAKELDAFQASFLTYHIYQALTTYPIEIADEENKIRINDFYEWVKEKAGEYNKTNSSTKTMPLPNLLGNQKANFEIASIDGLKVDPFTFLYIPPSYKNNNNPNPMGFYLAETPTTVEQWEFIRKTITDNEICLPRTNYINSKGIVTHISPSAILKYLNTFNKYRNQNFDGYLRLPTLEEMTFASRIQHRGKPRLKFEKCIKEICEMDNSGKHYLFEQGASLKNHFIRGAAYASDTGFRTCLYF